MDVAHAGTAAILEMNKDDEDRRKQVRELLEAGALHSGKDFEHAAFIFQHSNTPSDYLLAHTLAMAAVAPGDTAAIWIASATLDRYLNFTKQPQIYGTQFHTAADSVWTQEPYNRTLISDALRRELRVPVQAAQEKKLEDMNSKSK